MLRVLATWDPTSLPVPDQEGVLEMSASLGWLPGIDADDFFAKRFDQRDDFPRGEETDVGWARETQDGIELRRHPEIELLSHPELQPLVGRWRHVSDRELRLSDYDRMSGFEIRGWLVMLAAHHRKVKAELHG